MDSYTLIRFMWQTAKKDFLGGKGRIIISDFLKELPTEKKPTSLEMLQAWRKYHPDIRIQLLTNNLIIIHLGRFYYEKEPKVELMDEEERVRV